MKKFILLGETAANDLVVLIKIERQRFAHVDFVADIAVDQSLQLFGGRRLMELLEVAVRKPPAICWTDDDGLAAAVSLDVLDRGPDEQTKKDKVEKWLADDEGPPCANARPGGRFMDVIRRHRFLERLNVARHHDSPKTRGSTLMSMIGLPGMARHTFS